MPSPESRFPRSGRITAPEQPLLLPRSARLVVWGNALLRGLVSPDEAVERVSGLDAPVRVAGLPATRDPVGLALAFGCLRRVGVAGLRLVLPVAGDPRGLPGPPAFNALAVTAGEAALTVGGVALGLLPYTQAADDAAASPQWTAYDVTPSAVTDHVSLADAENDLLRAVRRATALISALEIARDDPEAVAALRAQDASSRDGLAPGYPTRAHRVLAQALQVATITRLAKSRPGGAVSAGQLSLRDGALASLATASRRAVAAACNAVLEPSA